MNYLKIAWRHLKAQKGFTFIYVFGLSVGLAVVILDGLWIADELGFNKYHKHYNQIAQVKHHDLVNGEYMTWGWNPAHLSDLLQKDDGSDFKYIVMSTAPADHIITYQEKKLSQEGNYMDKEAPEMLSLEMASGSRQGLNNMYSIMLSQSLARTLFGNKDPLHAVIHFDNKVDVQVSGVYKDLPLNSEFKNLHFIAPWDLLLTLNPGMKSGNPWNNNNYFTYVQIADRGDFSTISDKIRDIRKRSLTSNETDPYKTTMFLEPMSKWHLYAQYKNGVNTGGQITYVWLFGTIGIFILLLAIVNFINLSTANSQGRAREIGIRKTMGSLRQQLMFQFLSESLLIVLFSFLCSLILVLLALPFFNSLTDKHLLIDWRAPVFWIICLGTTLITGIFAGLYPALYLSSFKPVKVLKGEFKFGRLAILQRKSLLVFQYCISVILIVGTLIIYQQIQFAKSRSAGYQINRLITFPISPEINARFSSFRDELKKSGAVAEVTKSANPTTDYYIADDRFQWIGKDANLTYSFPVSNVTSQFGQTIDWKIIQGRDFSESIQSDSSAFILNESAIRYMGFKNPIGQTVTWNGKAFHVIGVIKDIIYESPYQNVQPYIYQMTGDQSYFVTARLNSRTGIQRSLQLFKKVFEKFNPALPFDFKFVDQEYRKKFGEEDRFGQLAALLSVLAIMISCLGIFGLAALMADQRRKEIGIRKILGSSLLALWTLLSGDFVKLFMLSLFIAFPIAWYFMNKWLAGYSYRTAISWQPFGLTVLLLFLITLITISYQIVKAAIQSPLKVLRTE